METSSNDSRNRSYQKEIYISWKKPEGGGKLVILNLNDGDFFSLEDPVSIGIWEQLMAGKTERAILDELVRDHADEDPAGLARDMDDFIGDLTRNKLLCPCPASGAPV